MKKKSRPERSSAGVGLIESGHLLYLAVLTRNLSDPCFTLVGLQARMGSSECFVRDDPECPIVTAA
jgi:hypothetical protein